MQSVFFQHYNGPFCENESYCHVSLQSTSTNDTKQPHKGFRVFSSGIFRGTSTAAPHIWSFPLHVPGHCIWKPDHQLRLPPPHSHVLLPLQPVLQRHLFHLHHHPKDAAKQMETEQSHHLWRLCHPDAFFHTVCRVGWLPPDCDGLWSVCGHLPPPSLHGHHEHPALCNFGSS